MNVNECDFMLDKIDLNELYKTISEIMPNYLVQTKNGSFAVFQTLTYGDMLISFLLLLILLVLTFNWIWSLLR
jgi:hypothetical protein